MRQHHPGKCSDKVRHIFHHPHDHFRFRLPYCDVDCCYHFFCKIIFAISFLTSVLMLQQSIKLIIASKMMIVISWYWNINQMSRATLIQHVDNICNIDIRYLARVRPSDHQQPSYHKSNNNYFTSVCEKSFMVVH